MAQASLRPLVINMTETIDFIRQLTDKAAGMLYPINMWSGEQTDSGAKITMNQKITPKDVEHKDSVSFRPNILSIPCSRAKR